MTSGTTSAPTLNLRRFWLIPVVAVIGGILGFGVSYLFGVSYEAKTRVLNRVNNVTFLGSNGTTLSQQGATVEQSAVSRTVAETEGALMENDVIATMVVRELNLDVSDEGGFFNSIKNAFATAIKYPYAYVRYGTYKDLNDFDQAVKDAQSGLSAKQVGNSYVLEVTGRWDKKDEAIAIANAGADHLVALAQQQFLDDVAANTENLARQVEAAGEEQQKAANELGAFAEAAGIPTANLGVALTPQLAAQLPPAAQSTYNQLQQAYNTALATYTQLQGQYQQAQVNAGIKPVELTRLDQAVPEVYPVSPKRWLFLALGIVLGAVVGLLLSMRAAWRRGETLFPRDDDLPGGPRRASLDEAAPVDEAARDDEHSSALSAMEASKPGPAVGGGEPP